MDLEKLIKKKREKERRKQSALESPPGVCWGEEIEHVGRRRKFAQASNSSW